MITIHLALLVRLAPSTVFIHHKTNKYFLISPGSR